MVSQNLKILKSLFKALKKKYSHVPELLGKERQVLELLVYAFFLENTPIEKANKAFLFLERYFIDWNEVRVSSTSELSTVFNNIFNPPQTGERIRRTLQWIFDTTYKFDLEDLRSKTEEEARSYLETIPYLTQFSINFVLMRLFSSNVAPLDEGMLRILRLLDFVQINEQNHEISQELLSQEIPDLLMLLCLLHELGTEFLGDPNSEEILSMLYRIDPEAAERSWVSLTGELESNDPSIIAKKISKEERKPRGFFPLSLEEIEVEESPEGDITEIIEEVDENFLEPNEDPWLEKNEPYDEETSSPRSKTRKQIEDGVQGFKNIERTPADLLFNEEDLTASTTASSHKTPHEPGKKRGSRKEKFENEALPSLESGLVHPEDAELSPVSPPQEPLPSDFPKKLRKKSKTAEKVPEKLEEQKKAEDLTASENLDSGSQKTESPLFFQNDEVSQSDKFNGAAPLLDGKMPRKMGIEENIKTTIIQKTVEVEEIVTTAQTANSQTPCPPCESSDGLLIRTLESTSRKKTKKFDSVTISQEMTLREEIVQSSMLSDESVVLPTIEKKSIYTENVIKRETVVKSDCGAKNNVSQKNQRDLFSEETSNADLGNVAKGQTPLFQEKRETSDAQENLASKNDHADKTSTIDAIDNISTTGKAVGEAVAVDKADAVDKEGKTTVLKETDNAELFKTPENQTVEETVVSKKKTSSRKKKETIKEDRPASTTDKVESPEVEAAKAEETKVDASEGQETASMFPNAEKSLDGEDSLSLPKKKTRTEKKKKSSEK